MNSSLLFLDESFCNATNITSVTGLRVPLQKFEEVQLAFRKQLKYRLGLDQDMLFTRLPHLHGSSMLEKHDQVTDDLKLAVFSDVVDLVLNAELSLYRVGYYVSSTFRKIAGRSETGEEMGQGFAWTDIVRYLEPYLENNYVIPIMDGFNERQVERFSQLIGTTSMIRSQGHEEILSIRHTNRIIGEVFFASHRHSVLTQIVDVCSYLRHMCDRERAEILKSDFAIELANIGECLKPSMAIEVVKVIRYEGKLTGPKDIIHVVTNSERLNG